MVYIFFRNGIVLKLVYEDILNFNLNMLFFIHDIYLYNIMYNFKNTN